MGYSREYSSREQRDAMHGSRPLSPRRSRFMSDRDDRTLPPISHLLPDIGSSHPGRPLSRGSNHSPLSHYPQTTVSRGSSDHSPSYRYQMPAPPSSNRPPSPIHDYGDKYQGQASQDRYDLPYHSRPAAERPYDNYGRDAYSGKPVQASTPSNSAYAGHSPSGYRGSPYSSNSSDSRRRDEEYHTNLPPPPPPYHGNSNGHPPYSETGSYPNGRYDHYPPPPPTQAYLHSSAEVPRVYDHRVAPPPVSSHGSYHQSPHQAPHHPYSPLPPMPVGHYSSPDEPARKRRGNLPRWTTDIFKAWFLEHIAHPYPSEQEKNDLCVQTGCSMTQISNWFINARRRQTPVLTKQAEAERRLRDTATGRSSSNSD